MGLYENIKKDSNVKSALSVSIEGYCDKYLNAFDSKDNIIRFPETNTKFDNMIGVKEVALYTLEEKLNTLRKVFDVNTLNDLILFNSILFVNRYKDTNLFPEFEEGFLLKEINLEEYNGYDFEVNVVDYSSEFVKKFKTLFQERKNCFKELGINILNVISTKFGKEYYIVEMIVLHDSKSYLLKYRIDDILHYNFNL